MKRLGSFILGAVCIAVCIMPVAAYASTIVTHYSIPVNYSGATNYVNGRKLVVSDYGDIYAAWVDKDAYGKYLVKFARGRIEELFPPEDTIVFGLCAVVGCGYSTPPSPALDVDWISWLDEIWGPAPGYLAFKHPDNGELCLFIWRRDGSIYAKYHDWDPGTFPTLSVCGHATPFGMVYNSSGQAFMFEMGTLERVTDWTDPLPASPNALGCYPASCIGGVFGSSDDVYTAVGWTPTEDGNRLAIREDRYHDDFSTTYDIYDFGTIDPGELPQNEDGYPSIGKKGYVNQEYYIVYSDSTTSWDHYGLQDSIRVRKYFTTSASMPTRFKPSSGEGYPVWDFAGDHPQADVQAPYWPFQEDAYVPAGCVWSQQWGLNDWTVYVGRYMGRYDAPDLDDWAEPFQASPGGRSARYPHAAFSDYYKRLFVMWTQENPTGPTLEIKTYRIVDISGEKILTETPHYYDVLYHGSDEWIKWQLKEELRDSTTYVKIELYASGGPYEIMSEPFAKGTAPEMYLWENIGVDEGLDPDVEYDECQIKVTCYCVGEAPLIDHSGLFKIVPRSMSQQPAEVKESITVTPFDLCQPEISNGTASIRYSVPHATKATLTVYDISGHKVATLVDNEVSAGSHEVTWDGSDHTGRQVSAGVYFVRMSADQFQASKKMVLVK